MRPASVLPRRAAHQESRRRRWTARPGAPVLSCCASVHRPEGGAQLPAYLRVDLQERAIALRRDGVSRPRLLNAFDRQYEAVRDYPGATAGKRGSACRYDRPRLLTFAHADGRERSSYACAPPLPRWRSASRRSRPGWGWATPEILWKIRVPRVLAGFGAGARAGARGRAA
jgi:hypothetical protein